MLPDEMKSTASPASARLTSNNQPRRVLGDVSPNVRPAAPAGTPGGKMLTGSPLKRSFTAAMEGGQGFRYLKKRKFSIDSPLSQMMTAEEAAVQDGPTKVEQSQAPLLGLNDLPLIQQLDPTRPNTPTGSVNGDEDEHESSADRRSFSSLINYDPSSQTAPSSQQPQPSGLVFNGLSRAEVLRLRLRVAWFKVQTNQISVPLSELHVEETVQKQPDAPLKPTHAHPHPSASRLLPAPILRPTQYSNRVIYEFPEPCSPPADSPDKLPCGPTLSTPNSTRRTGPDEQELTSSIVKGRVAEGLLGLRNGF